jgi:DNA-cytosine methyltransferase
MYKVLDLFSGIGGFSLGLESTGGFETIAFCEVEKYPLEVLNKHWPNVPVYNDIKELTYEKLKEDNLVPDVITGGFPCQDISCAGKGKGIKAERSGLWSEMFRLIRDVRPTWAIIENVSTLRSKGLTLVLQNLSSIGYYAEWHCIPASAIGANHQRDRIWIVAHPYSKRDESFIREEISRWKNEATPNPKFSSRSERGDSLFNNISAEEVGNTDSEQVKLLFNGGSVEGSTKATPKGELHSSDTGSNRPKDMANSNNTGNRTSKCGDMSEDGTKTHEGQDGDTQSRSSRLSTEMADSDSQRWGRGHFEGCADGERKLLQGEQEGGKVGSETEGCCELRGVSQRDIDMANTSSCQGDGYEFDSGDGRPTTQTLFGNRSSVPRTSPWWEVEPSVGRVAHGIPKRVDRLKCLGNSVVPQIPQMIGYQILEIDKR